MSLTVENFTLTVSLGFSSVYKRRPDPFGFLPVPFFGSLPSFFSFFFSFERSLVLSTLTFDLSKKFTTLYKCALSSSDKP